MKTTINKSDWLTAKECLTQAWLGLRESASPPPTEAELFRMEQGQEIGALARELFPNGVLVSKTASQSAAAVTEALRLRGVAEMFEATFVAGPFVAKADILIRDDSGWHVLEVKSSFSDTSKLPELVDDLAYTTMVLKRSGLSVTRASLVLLSRSYRFGDASNRLFEIIDQTTEVLERVAEFESDAESIAEALLASDAPKPVLASACRDCSYFETKCLGAGLEHTVLELPGLHQKKLMRLSEDGVIDLSQLPEDFELNERQERAKRGALSGYRIVEPTLRAVLDSIVWPCSYLDFETVATALPLYDEHGCHHQVLTQFSVHRRATIDGEVQHREFLADASKDCQREVAVALVEALAGAGSVIVYSSFEKTRITALRNAFPDLSTALQNILDRLVDLHPFVADHVYDPAFKGSFSIKKVLPALAPDLSYEGLVIANGDTAIARFARMARGEIQGEAVETTRKHLLDYCKLDTLAMVRLHEALEQLAAKIRRAGGG